MMMMIVTIMIIISSYEKLRSLFTTEVSGGKSRYLKADTLLVEIELLSPRESFIKVV